MVLRLARTRYAGTNHTHLSELLSEREGIDIARTTLRRILVNAGISSPRRRRPPKHRVRRQRMPREGMLIQLDGSYHPWLGDDRPRFTLLIAVDDATGCVVNASFSEQEDARSYFLLLQGLVQRCGIPLALYTDRHGVFRHTPGSVPAGTSTQFSRAMDELGIQLIFALSPQAKGRVERAAGTFQDRLVTELRLAGASTIEQANNVLEQFLPRFNQHFKVPAQYPEIAFRQLDTELRLEQVLCFKHSSCCLDRIVPAMPERWWRSWQHWMAGCRCGVRGAPPLPRRRCPLRYFSEMAAGHSPTCLYLISAPVPWQKAGARLLRHWTQWQMTPKKAALP